jgi:hypothetical protein
LWNRRRVLQLPEFERLTDLLSGQLPDISDLFRYALVLAMIDDEKARVMGTQNAQMEGT